MRWTWGTAALLLGSATAPLAAQDEDPTIDRIVAVVGSAAITNSQVEEELFARQGAGLVKIPQDPILLAKLKRQFVDTLIADELLFQEAATDTTIKVSAQEVSDAVDKVMRDSRRSFKTDAEFQRELRAAGFQNVEEWRRHLFDQQRRTLTIGRFRENLTNEGKLAAKNPTEKEIRVYYDANRDILPPVPGTVSIRQMVLASTPSPDALAATRLVADSIIRELRAGADFAVAARRFSQDPGSAAQGGSLGWMRPDAFVREFADAVQALPRGVISEPVVTSFGVHIIQVERHAPTEVLVRHILLVPAMDTGRAQAAQALAERLRAAVVAGATFDSLQRIHHDPGEEKEIRGFPIPQLLPSYVAPLADLPVGELSPVFALSPEGTPGGGKWAFVRLLDRTEPGPPSFDLIKEGIRRELGRQMGEEGYLDGLRRKTYIDIRLP